jgi:hypothetical protein
VEDLLAELLGPLLELLVEIAGEFLLQILFELAAESLLGLIKGEKQTRPAVWAMGLIVVGGGAGLLSAWIFPHRLIAARAGFRGVSLLLAPLATGAVMHLLGKRLRLAGRDPTDLATFRGGALFAFAMALIRWCLLAGH